MRRKITRNWTVLFALALALCAQQPARAAVPGEISFQGFLTDTSGVPINVPASMTFRIYDADVGGTELWSETQTVTPDEGRYAVLLGEVTSLTGLAFDMNYWLEVEVNSDGPMAPRYKIATSPFAFTARNADTVDNLHASATPLAGELLALDASGMFPSSVLPATDAATLGGLANTAFWQIGGNTGLVDPTGNLFGTTDNVALNIIVDGARALRIEPTPLAADAPNIIGGHPLNAVTAGVVGATISGGGFNDGTDLWENRVTANYGTIGGGRSNTASGIKATVSGGQQNLASGGSSTIGGGESNTTSLIYATVGGGRRNTASGLHATVGGGDLNDAQADFATIAGGGPSDTGDPSNTNNRVFDDYGTIGGGGYNRVGSDDADTTTATFATVGGGFLNMASSWDATVSGGYSNTASGIAATVSGGDSNTASGGSATIGGGTGNTASLVATVSGGTVNAASGNSSAIGGGYGNTASGIQATVGGGDSNWAGGLGATVSGGRYNTASAGATVGGGEGNLAQANYATIAGGGPSDGLNGVNVNIVYDDWGTIGGGGNNRAGSDDGDTTSATFATVGGGAINKASAIYSTVSGGYQNTASWDGSTVGGGSNNTASNYYATIGGGEGNSASGWFYSTVSGGSNNTASGSYAAIGGGEGNLASGWGATVPGGENNNAGGSYSFAAGRRATIFHDGSFVWADLGAAIGGQAFYSAASNEFAARARGGFRFVTAVNIFTGAPEAGVAIPAGTNSLQAIGSGDLTLNAATTINGNTTVNGELTVSSRAYGMVLRTTPFDLTAIETWFDLPFTGGNTNLYNVTHNTIVNPERITVNVPGTYMIQYRVQLRRQTANHKMTGRLWKNAISELPGSFSMQHAYGVSSGQTWQLSGHVIASLLAGDFFSVQIETDLSVLNEVDLGSLGASPPATPITASLTIVKLGP